MRPTELAFELVAFGAHPDDVELACGGIISAFAQTAANAAIVDLTSGERATRGSPVLRAAEGEHAAACLGASRFPLELPDTQLRATSPEQRAQVVRLLRRLKPSFVLLPHPGDPHPDHREASLLIQDAAFLSGVGGFQPELGDPHRPSLLLAYPGPRQTLEPHVVVDVTRVYEKKRAALKQYTSQFDPEAGLKTHLASGYFLAAVEARDRVFGNLVGVPLAEGLFLIRPGDGVSLQAFLRKALCESV